MKGRAMPRDVSELIDGLPTGLQPTVSALRALIRKTVPDAVESLLWGGLSYHRPDVGGRVKGAVCLIGVKDGKVRLEFIHGVRLADPHRLLRGTRLSKRYVPVDGVAGARRRELAELLRAAASVDFAKPFLCEPGEVRPRRPA
jgi:hypothetical protein